MPYPDCPVTVVPSLLPCPICAILSACSVPHVLSHMSSPSCPAPSLFSPAHLSPQFGPCCHVLASCRLCPVQADLSGWPVETDLSGLSSPASLLMSCPRCRATTLLFMAVLPQLSHLSCPVLTALSFLSCSGHPILSFLSWLYHPHFLWLSVLTILPSLSCPSCPAPAFLSLALLPCCPVFVK